MNTFPENRFGPSPDVVLTELDSTEAVLLNTRTLEYFSLNETALTIWKSLASTGVVEDVVSVLQSEYEVTETVALDHVRHSIGELLSAGLLEPHENVTDAP